MPLRASIPGAGLAVLFAGIVLVAELRPAAAASVQDGVFSAEQAETGADLYAGQCAACHGDRLNGGVGGGPALSGPDFLDKWSPLSVSDLFQYVKGTMPEDRPGSLSNGQVANVLAYVLKFNGYPAGGKPLPTNPAALEGIKMAQP